MSNDLAAQARRIDRRARTTMDELMPVLEQIEANPTLAKHPQMVPMLDAIDAHLNTVLVGYAMVAALTGPSPVDGELPAPPPARMTTRPTGEWNRHAGTLVYVAYGADGQVLYVGITDDLFGRMTAHRRQSRWWGQAHRIHWTEWEDRDLAEMQEERLIRRHCPPYNTTHNPNARRNL